MRSILPWPLILAFLSANALHILLLVVISSIICLALFWLARVSAAASVSRISSRLLSERDQLPIIYEGNKTAFSLRSIKMLADGFALMEFDILDYAKNEGCMTRSSKSQCLISPKMLKKRRSFLGDCLPQRLLIGQIDANKVNPSSDYFFLVSNQHRAWALRKRLRDSIRDLKNKMEHANESRAKYQDLDYMPYAKESIDSMVAAIANSIERAEDSLVKIENAVEFLTMRIESLEDFGVELRDLQVGRLQERAEIDTDINQLLVDCEEIELLRQSL